ncbi:sigma-70 family RNA polymerase sigma factor [Streptomyces sp. NPDC000188]|uniref:RNA polymerase sigma factor n=1 Tax=unclassified Streptomyces TaxID=2593676 RepID=UPI00332AA526
MRLQPRLQPDRRLVDRREVVSLTFLEAWRLRDRVEPEGGSLRPWLLGVATNVTRNLRRATRRHAAAVSRLPRAEAEADDQARIALVHTAPATLRRPEREVLALCVWSGLDHPSAARALGVPVGTVRSRLFRARRKLAGAMELPRPDGQMKGGHAPVAGPIQEGNHEHAS